MIFQHLCDGGKGIMGLSVEMHGNVTKLTQTNRYTVTHML